MHLPLCILFAHKISVNNKKCIKLYQIFHYLKLLRNYFCGIYSTVEIYFIFTGRLVNMYQYLRSIKNIDSLRILYGLRQLV